MLITLLIACPVVAAIISIAVKKNLILERVAAIAAVVEFVAGVAVVSQVVEVGGYKVGTFFDIDALNAIVLLIIVTIGLAATFYSIGYLREEVLKKIIFHRVRQYYILLHFFFAAMLFAVSTTNPIMMWIAIEATTLSTAFLISFYGKPTSLEAAWKYLIINSVGLLLGFLGTLLFFTATHDTGSGFISWQTLLQNATNLNPVVAKIAFIFAFIGYGTKVGFVPMHTWKPDAYSKAPAPLGALFTGPLLSIALLAILRYKIIVDAAVGAQYSSQILVFFGSLTLLVASLIIFTQKNYKRLFTYSSIEHAGLMALGFGFGGVGVFMALLHLIYHSLAKSVIFFSSGNLLLKYGSAKIVNVKGSLKILPITSVLLLLGFLAITGVPPFGLFITEFYILAAGISGHLFVSIVAILSLALIFAGFLKHVSQMMFGDAPAHFQKGEFNYLTLASPIFLLVLLVVLGFFLPTPLRSLLTAASNLIQK